MGVGSWAGSASVAGRSNHEVDFDPQDSVKRGPGRVFQQPMQLTDFEPERFCPHLEQDKGEFLLGIVRPTAWAAAWWCRIRGGWGLQQEHVLVPMKSAADATAQRP